ncbi:hypothetical protein DPMN_099601 [Dreissena polymorpha]|uniref:Uncharacterized protein n=1 Tax=Dreissena polymorpha TaxID=45954 RepID=A0A9D4LFT7_DREPO|nr:hypothetical protein DPMN_099601 [Dreissena polymorpha]
MGLKPYLVSIVRNQPAHASSLVGTSWYVSETMKAWVTIADRVVLYQTAGMCWLALSYTGWNMV